MFIVRLMVQELADLYADDKFDDPTLHLVPPLVNKRGLLAGGGEAQKVIDVTGYREGYQVHLVDVHGNRDSEFYAHDGEDWFTTTDKTVRALALD